MLREVKPSKSRRGASNDDSLQLVMYKLDEIGNDVKELTADVKILNEDLLKRRVTAKIFWASIATLAAVTAWAGDLLDNVLAVWRP